MGRVLKSILVEKPEQLSKLDSGPVHIILRPNLRIRDKKKVAKNGK